MSPACKPETHRNCDRIESQNCSGGKIWPWILIRVVNRSVQAVNQFIVTRQLDYLSLLIRRKCCSVEVHCTCAEGIRMGDKTDMRKADRVSAAASPSVASNATSSAQDQPSHTSWKDSLSGHPLVVVAGAVIAVLGILFGAMTTAKSIIHAEVAAQLRQRITAEVLYSINEAGATSGSVENILRAIRDRRPISVRYAPVSDQKTEWTRRCDDFSIDPQGSSGLTISCFILRVPDTAIENAGRKLSEASTFEDHIVTSSGTREMRLYRIDDGRIVVDQHRSPAPVPAIEWTAPIISLPL